MNKLLLIFFTLIAFGSSIDNSTIKLDSTPDVVSFTLYNKTLNSIPLIIPGVMNPNLSPRSKSGVSLKVGQCVLFKHRGKKQILIIVTKELEGQTLDVAKLIKEKVNELERSR